MVTLPLALALLALPQSAARPEGQLVWGDVQADGVIDVLAIAPDGRAALLVGERAGGFLDRTGSSGLELGGGVRAARWADVDGDALLDLALLESTGALRLWLNQGQATFVDASVGAGLEIPYGATALEWFDYDEDARPDLVVSLPTGELLFHGLGAARFERVELPVGGLPAAIPGVPVTPVAALSPGASAALAAAGASLPGAGGASDLMPFPYCTPGIRDAAGLTGCITASSIPTMGSLLPLGPELFVSPLGDVGIGTTSPSSRLQVAGTVRGDADVIAGNQLRSLAIGVAPLVVQSSTLVTNLNADRLDGLHASVFSQLGPSIEGVEITDGTVTASDLGANSVGSSELAPSAVSDAHVSTSAAIAGFKIRPFFTPPVGIGTSTPTEALTVIGNVDASGLVSGDRSWSNTSSASTAVTGYNTGTGKAGHFEIQSSGNTRDAISGVTNGLGSAAFFSATNTGSTSPVIEAGTLGNGNVLSAYAYGHGAAARLEVQNTSNATAGALYVVTNGAGDGIQVHHSRSATEGLYVRHTGSNGWGVWSTATASGGVGVRGDGRNALSYGVWGDSDNIGVVGSTTDSQSLAIWSNGNFQVSGSKNFVQPHPTDPSREIVFTCLEGNESGTYFRGTAELVGGSARVAVPEEFRLVTESEGLSVQLTPVGARAVLWVESQDLDQVVVRGDADVRFHYQVNGVRRGFPEQGRIRPARAFVPEVRGVPYGTQFPDELRRILVENGTLNADFTPSETTAAVQGWRLRDPEEGRAQAASEPQTPAMPAAASGEKGVRPDAAPGPAESDSARREDGPADRGQEGPGGRRPVVE